MCNGRDRDLMKLRWLLTMMLSVGLALSFDGRSHSAEPMREFKNVTFRIGAACFTHEIDDQPLPPRARILSRQGNHRPGFHGALGDDRLSQKGGILGPVKNRHNTLMEICLTTPQAKKNGLARRMVNFHDFALHHSRHQAKLQWLLTFRPTTAEIETRPRMSSRNEGGKRMARL